MSLEKTTKFPLIISGPTCCGKSVLASKYTGQTIHSTQLKRKDMYHYLLNIFRDNVILNYSSVYEVIEGKVININNNSITLKNDEVESVYSTGPLFRAALIKENVNLGDNIRFNISTGKLNKVEEIEKDGEMQKNKTIISEVSLLTIDNLNSNTNILSLNKISDSIRKTTNKNVKNSLKNTSLLKLNYLKIEDIHLLNLEELNVINDLLYEDYKPNLIFSINFDKLSLEKKDTKLFSKCEEISLKKEDSIEKILNEKKVGDVNLDENVRLFLKNHPDRLGDVIDCAKIVSVDKKKGFEKLIGEFNK